MSAMHCLVRMEGGQPAEARLTSACLSTDEYNAGWRVVAACPNAPTQILGVFLVLGILAERGTDDIIAVLPEPLRVAVIEVREQVGRTPANPAHTSAPTADHFFAGDNTKAVA